MLRYEVVCLVASPAAQPVSAHDQCSESSVTVHLGCWRSLCNNQPGLLTRQVELTDCQPHAACMLCFVLQSLALSAMSDRAAHVSCGRIQHLTAQQAAWNVSSVGQFVPSMRPAHRAFDVSA